MTAGEGAGREVLRTRSSISETAQAARSVRRPRSRSDQRRGAESIALRAPSTFPSRSMRGTPAYGDPPQLAHRRVGADQRVAPGVLHDESGTGLDDMAAERVGQRSGASRGPWLGKASGALEELPVLVNQGDERDGGAQQPSGQAGQPVERLFGRRVQQRCPPHRGQPSRLRWGLTYLGHDEAESEVQTGLVKEAHLFCQVWMVQVFSRRPLQGIYYAPPAA